MAFLDFIAFFAHLLHAINGKNGDLLACGKNCLKSPFYMINYRINHIFAYNCKSKSQKLQFLCKKMRVNAVFSREIAKNHEILRKIAINHDFHKNCTILVIEIVIFHINCIRTQFSREKLQLCVFECFDFHKKHLSHMLT